MVGVIEMELVFFVISDVIVYGLLKKLDLMEVSVI